MTGCRPRKFHRSVLLVGWAVLPLLFGCGAESRPAPGPSKADADATRKLTICLLPKIKGISYFSSCYRGAQEAADELGGIELIYDGPTDGDPRKQAEMIEQWTADRVDVICVSPNAPDVVAKAMQDARKAGIKVLTWDADGNPESREFFINQASAQTIGESMVRVMVEDLAAVHGSDLDGGRGDRQRGCHRGESERLDRGDETGVGENGLESGDHQVSR